MDVRDVIFATHPYHRDTKSLGKTRFVVHSAARDRDFLFPPHNYLTRKIGHQKPRATYLSDDFVINTIRVFLTINPHWGKPRVGEGGYHTVFVGVRYC